MVEFNFVMGPGLIYVLGVITGVPIGLLLALMMGAKMASDAKKTKK